MSFIQRRTIFILGRILAQTSLAQTPKIPPRFHQFRPLSQNLRPKFKSFDRHEQKPEVAESKINQERIIQEAIREKIKNLSDIESLKNDVLKKGKYIKENTFDTSFLQLCILEKSHEIGFMFFDHLYDQNHNLNIGVANKFFRLCYNSKKNDDRIFPIYQNLLERYEILDASTCENVVLALSLTQKWKEIERVMEMCRASSMPSHRMFSVWATAALENGEEELAWKIMDQGMEINRKPSLDLFCALLKDKANMKRTLKWLEKHNEHIQIELAYEMMEKHSEFFKDRLKSSLTSITPEGKCRKCLKSLKNVDVTLEEFDRLKELFLNPVLIGRDIFLKTKPSELKAFLDFLEQNGKVDVVLDGLNIAFGTSKTGSHAYGSILKTVVESFVQRNKKVIVLGRRHMQKWPAHHIQYIKQNSSLFLTDNVTADDPYLLYATMYSGLGTTFVSRDQMRGHKFLLKDETLKKIFSKWQQKHQRYVKYISDDGKVFLHKPPPYLMEIHETADGDFWHLPIVDDTPGADPLQQVYNRTWLCLKN